MPTNRKEYIIKYAKVNRKRINTQSVARQRKRKQEAISLLGGKCTDCNTIFPPACYDFHHIDPTQKDFNPYIVLSRNYGTFINEIKKCVLLCANCHRIRHYGLE